MLYRVLCALPLLVSSRLHAADGTGAGGRAGAWLSVSSGPCALDAGEVAARVSERVAGARHPELTAQLELRERAGGVEVAVRLASPEGELGSQQVEVATCEEAHAAAVAVLALALSSGVGPGAAVPSEQRAPSTPPERASRTAASGTEPRAGSRSEALSGRASPVTTGLWVAGAEAGASSVSTLVVGVGALAEVGGAELRALLWYGLPSFEEEARAARTSRTRTDSIVFGLDYCRPQGRGRWLSLCAGAEARMTRRARRSEAGAAASEGAELGDGTVLQPGGAVCGGFRLVERELAWQPQLEASASWALVGQGRSGLGGRVALGGALPF